jgi:GPH family glycoside/pentoside/hexuronide:cation symporter
MSEERKTPVKKKILFGLNAFPDQLTYQAFTIYVFTFYFSVIKLTMFEMWIGFILWGVWNMFNDPLLGALSERTKQKGKLGKRKFYLIISFIPLSLMMIFLFTTPLNIKLFYFIFIIFLFEFFYTMFSVNTNAVFPEMFPTEKERASTNVFIKAFTMIAVITASLVPTIIISPLVPLTESAEEAASIQSMYITAGIILCCITLAMAILFIFFAVEEKEEKKDDFEKRPNFIESLKITFSNKTFMKFTFGNMLIWYCFNILLTVFPLYAVFILDIKAGSLQIGITLMIGLLAAAALMPLQAKLRKKLGTRKALMVGLAIWIVTLFPLTLLTNDLISKMVLIFVFVAMGIGLSAALFYIDIIHGDIIDQDALKFGVKRAGSYYGVNAFIHRFSTILAITTIAIVFSGTGWSTYEPLTNDPELIKMGLRILIFVFPSLALVGAILLFKSYDLHGEKLEKMREELAKHPELK